MRTHIDQELFRCSTKRNLGRFPFNGLTGQTRIFVSVSMEGSGLYVSQISSENGPHSNFIKIFRSDRSNAQTFCLSFNNLAVLTGLAVLIENAPTFIWSRILRLAVLEFVRFHAFRVDPRRNQTNLSAVPNPSCHV